MMTCPTKFSFFENQVKLLTSQVADKKHICETLQNNMDDLRDSFSKKIKHLEEKMSALETEKETSDAVISDNDERIKMLKNINQKQIELTDSLLKEMKENIKIVHKARISKVEVAMKQKNEDFFNQIAVTVQLKQNLDDNTVTYQAHVAEAEGEKVRIIMFIYNFSLYFLDYNTYIFIFLRLNEFSKMIMDLKIINNQ